MNKPNGMSVGKFIWNDLAAADTAAAIDFYQAVFGWTADIEHVNGGQFIRLKSDGQDIGSMYTMSPREREFGVPSHWTSYICVENIEATSRKVVAAGGVILVRPFTVSGIANIAIIADNLGSIIGLWESLPYE